MPVNLCHKQRLFYLVPADGTTVLWVMSNWPCRLAKQDIKLKYHGIGGQILTCM